MVVLQNIVIYLPLLLRLSKMYYIYFNLKYIILNFIKLSKDISLVLYIKENVANLFSMLAFLQRYVSILTSSIILYNIAFMQLLEGFPMEGVPYRESG